MALPEDTILENRYRIDRLLGKGGMGAIYRGFDSRLDINVAIKENFLQTPQSIQQFQQEARILARLKHRGLPSVLDHFSFEGQQYLVMEFIEGEDLWELVKRQRSPLAEDQALKYVIQVCEAVAYLHRQKPPIIHRDIKPQNIKITPTGRAVLVDFGIAKVAEDTSRTRTGAQAVTPGFSPPEQYSGEGTREVSDVYALGATLYALLTGKKPPDSITMMVNQAKFEPPRVVNTALSQEVSEAVVHAMQVHPDNRPQTMAVWQEELQSVLEKIPWTNGSQNEETFASGAVLAPGFSDAAPTHSFWLIDSQGQGYPLGEEPLVIGRHAEADVVLESSNASRQHALIRVDGDTCQVMDNGSANGTFINKERLGFTWHPFNPGETLEIGDVHFDLTTTPPSILAPLKPGSIPAALDDESVTALEPTPRPPTPAPSPAAAAAPPVALPDSQPEPIQPQERAMGPIIIIGVIVLALLGAGAFFLFGRGPSAATITATAQAQAATNTAATEVAQAMVVQETETAVAVAQDATETAEAEAEATAQADAEAAEQATAQAEAEAATSTRQAEETAAVIADTNAAMAATATAQVAPTETPVPTEEPATAEPPTATPLPPTATSPPAATATPTRTPTSAVVEPTATPRPLGPTVIPVATIDSIPQIGNVTVTDVDVNPSNPNEVYALVKGNVNAIYKSTSGGIGPWGQLEIDASGITGLVIDPTNPARLFAPAWNAVLRSDDGGNTWKAFGDGLSTANRVVDVVAVDPKNPNNVYAGIGSTLVASTNGGTSWTSEEIGSGLGQGRFTLIVIDPFNSNTIFVGGELGSLYRSVDTGRTFTQLFFNTGEGAYGMAAHPEDNGVFLVGINSSEAGMMKTENGADFQSSSNGLIFGGADSAYSGVVYAPSNPDIVYTGSGYESNGDAKGIFKSTDGGKSWDQVITGLPIDNSTGYPPFVRKMAVHPTNPNIVIAATGAGLYRTTNGGESWTAQ